MRIAFSEPKSFKVKELQTKNDRENFMMACDFSKALGETTSRKQSQEKKICTEIVQRGSGY